MTSNNVVNVIPNVVPAFRLNYNAQNAQITSMLS